MTILVVAEAFIFMTVIKVEPITLFAMLAAAAIGAVIGAGYVSKLEKRKVQLGMGIALLVVAVVMLAGQLKLFASFFLFLMHLITSIRSFLIKHREL